MVNLPPISRMLDSRVSREIVRPADWGRRIATVVAAVLIGLIALVFAKAGDQSRELFLAVTGRYRFVHLVLTPAIFVAIAALTIRFAPEARGSGIPQVIAASRHPRGRSTRALVSLRASSVKMLLTLVALVGGASVGREGPTVQLGATIMVVIHRLFRVRVTPGVIIAGGAAGVAAAFNTPLAGIAFAIEELSVTYEQRVAIVVMGAVMIAGLTAQGVAGNYIYFGELTGGIPVSAVLVAAPLAGLIGGAMGGAFSRAFLALRGPRGRWAPLLARKPLYTALACGVVVGVLGFVTKGATSGTGYNTTQMLLAGGAGEYWFGPAKFAAALVTSVSGIPGGIFAPSLAVGAGFGQALTTLFPAEHAGAIVLLGMAGYFTGVVRAPLTTVIILSETTGSSQLILPLFATALIGDWAGGLVCREHLYLELSRDFLPQDKKDRPDRPAPPLAADLPGEPELPPSAG